VVAGFAQQQYLSIHALRRGEHSMLVELVWRKGAQSPKIDALHAVLKPLAADAPVA
jgi:hypothetical protein